MFVNPEELSSMQFFYGRHRLGGEVWTDGISGKGRGERGSRRPIHGAPYRQEVATSDARSDSALWNSLSKYSISNGKT